MDKSDELRLKYLKIVISNLFTLNEELAKKSCSNALVVLESAGATCTLTDKLDLKGDISILNSDSYLEFFNQLVSPFEQRYGMGKFWNSFKRLTIKFYASNRDDVFSGEVDLPVMNFKVKSFHVARSGNLPYSGRVEWVDTVFSLKTRGIVVFSGDSVINIPLSCLVAIDREIYRRDSGESNILKSIDFRISGPMESILISGEPNIVSELMKLIGFIRKEYQRMMPLEREVLYYIGKVWSVEDILNKLEKGPEEVMSSCKRLRDRGYIDEFNIITATGVQAISEYAKKKAAYM